MCIHIYVYVYIYTPIYVYIYMCTNRNIYIHIYISINIGIYDMSPKLAIANGVLTVLVKGPCRVCRPHCRRRGARGGEKPRQTIQSPGKIIQSPKKTIQSFNGRYKATKRQYKAPTDNTKTQHIRQNLKKCKTHKYQTRTTHIKQ